MGAPLYRKIKIKARLTPEDIEDNEEIHLRINYGAKKDFLLKKRTMDLEFKLKSYTVIIAASVGVLVLLALLIWFIFGKNKKNKIVNGIISLYTDNEILSTTFSNKVTITKEHM